MRTRLLNHFLPLLACWLLASLSFAGEFLPPDQAFSFSHDQQGNTLSLSWQIESGYYLYEQRISAFYETDTGVENLPLTFNSQSEIKHDKNFGEVPVFFHKAQASVALNSLPEGYHSIQVEYQGCAKNGLCYQPQTREITLQPLTHAVSNAAPAEATKSTRLADLNSTDSISSFLAGADFFTTVAIFLLLGIGLSLTPCILPMVPILSGIIVGQGESLTARRGIALSSAYVLGMAFTYAFAGVLAATFGAQGNLQLYMQNPWVISVFSLVFVALSLSMFGFYNLALPSNISNAIYSLSNKQQGGHLISVFVMGALSALVVSPCVSAPLAGALVFISSTGDKLMGATALFMLAIGMGLPLIAIGAGGGKLVPKAGAWMNQVKNLFGVILLGVAIWLLSRILPATVSMLLWAVLLIFYGVHSGALEPVASGKARLYKAASFTLLFYGCLLLIGAVTGGTDPLHPLQLVQQHETQSSQETATLFTRVSANEELDNAIKAASAAGQPVMLDFYADWCTACLDMEKHVFSQASVQQALKPFVLLQVDVTHNSKEHQKILDRFGLFGPPSLIFFDTHGKEIQGKRIQGELPAEAFIDHIENQVTACTMQAC